MNAEIRDIPLHETTRERYLNYALSVITSRALPDVRDGLKPVQRRILYAMHNNLRLLPDTKYRKSAAVVGEVMAKYHPHGDSSIYDAMVRMAQTFSLRYPLVDGQGNFGSLDGDNAAAMRYTEARLRHFAVELIDELRKRTVEMRPTYDGTLFEPVVLPAQVPNLLVNGSSGIAVGMATNIPPHNFGEVVAALCALIDRPQMTLEDIVPAYIRGPDFPTGGEILNDVESLREIYREGRGAIELRGTWVLEEEAKRRQAVITSVPFALDKSALIAEIAEHVGSGKVPQITDVRDESTEDVRIFLELRKGADAEAAMSYLYRRTALLSRFHVNLTALVPTDDPQVARPERLGLLPILRHFLDFRLEVTERRLRFDLEELERRIHILEGFEKVFDDLDEAIRLIRASSGKEDARTRLMARFDLDFEQAEAVLETKLYRLAKLEITSIRRELAEKRAEAAKIRGILADRGQLWALVRSELSELAGAYDDRRRTAITGPVAVATFDEEVYIVAEDSFVIVTRDGWIKRQKSFTDPSAIRVREGDSVGWILPCSTRETVQLFGDRGKVYTVRVADLPLTTGYGEFAGARFDLSDGEALVAVLSSDKRLWPRQASAMLAALPEDSPRPPYIFAATRGGRVLRLPLEPLCEPSTKSGRTYARLADGVRGGDGVLHVAHSDGEELVAVVSRDAKALLFAIGEVPVLGAAGKGVTAIKLSLGDVVVAAELVAWRPERPEAERILAVRTLPARDATAATGRVAGRSARGATEETKSEPKIELVSAQRLRPSGRGGAGRPLMRSGKVEGPVLAPVVLRLGETTGGGESAAIERLVAPTDQGPSESSARPASVTPAGGAAGAEVAPPPSRSDELAALFGGARVARTSWPPAQQAGLFGDAAAPDDAKAAPERMEVARLRPESAPPLRPGSPAGGVPADSRRSESESEARDRLRRLLQGGGGEGKPAVPSPGRAPRGRGRGPSRGSGAGGGRGREPDDDDDQGSLI